MVSVSKPQYKKGCCVHVFSLNFFNFTIFRIVEQLDITLSEYLSIHPDCLDIWTEVSKIKLLKQRLEERASASILQVSVVVYLVSQYLT